MSKLPDFIRLEEVGSNKPDEEFDEEWIYIKNAYPKDGQYWFSFESNFSDETKDEVMALDKKLVRVSWDGELKQWTGNLRYLPQAFLYFNFHLSSRPEVRIHTRVIDKYFDAVDGTDIDDVIYWPRYDEVVGNSGFQDDGDIEVDGLAADEIDETDI